MNLCHLKNSELEPNFKKYKGRVVLRGDIVKDDSRFKCSVHWARIISITNDSRKSHGHCFQGLPGCAGTSSIRLHPGQNGRCTNVHWKIPKSEWSQTFGSVYHDTNGLTHGPVWKTQSFLLKRYFIWSSFGRDYYGKSNLSKSDWKYELGESFPNWGMFYSCTVKKDYSLSVYVGWHQIGWKENKNINPMWESTPQRSFIWGEPTSFLDNVFFGLHSKENAKLARILWITTKVCLNLEFLLVVWKILPEAKAPRKNWGQNTVSSWSNGHGRSCEEMRGKILRTCE